MKIRADVVDIRNDSPLEGEFFLVDSNVWIWLFYERSGSSGLPDREQPQPYQVENYPNYIKEVRSHNGNLLRCDLCLNELSHRIEKVERLLFCNLNSTDNTISIKRYRHGYPTERQKVVRTIRETWQEIRRISTSVDFHFSDDFTNGALANLADRAVDAYDLFMIEAISQRNGRHPGSNSTIKVITDDGDFATVPGITVFTSNLTVIRQAGSQGRLFQRWQE
jgi:hypothetical protein